MKVAAFSLLAAGALCAGASAADARDLTGKERKGLAAAVSDFAAATAAGDAHRLAGYVPPGFFDLLAERMHAAPAEARRVVTASLEKALANIDIEEEGAALALAEFREFGDGEPYVIVPTKGEARLAGGLEVEIVTPNIAMLSPEGEWWIFHVGNPGTLALMAEAYPRLMGVPLPGRTITVLPSSRL